MSIERVMILTAVLALYFLTVLALGSWYIATVPFLLPMIYCIAMAKIQANGYVELLCIILVYIVASFIQPIWAIFIILWFAVEATALHLWLINDDNT